MTSIRIPIKIRKKFKVKLFRYQMSHKMNSLNKDKKFNLILLKSNKRNKSIIINFKEKMMSIDLVMRTI